MPAEDRPIVVVGSLNMDLVAYAPHIPKAGATMLGTRFEMNAGGKGANQAVAVAKLDYPVAMIGRVGNDTFGSQLRNSLEVAGVDVNAVEIVPGPSGVAVIVVAEDGENCIVVSPGANALLTPAELDRHADLLASAGIVLTQLEIPLESVEHLATLCQDHGVPLILDPAPARQLPKKLLQTASWLTPNQSEARSLLSANGSEAGNPSADAKALHSLGAQGVVLKLGDKGSYVSAKPEESFHVDAFPVQVCDTTAAGDAFNGAFAVGLMRGLSARASARFASGAAAIAVTRSGAQPSMPTLAETRVFLAKHGT